MQFIKIMKHSNQIFVLEPQSVVSKEITSLVRLSEFRSWPSLCPDPYPSPVRRNPLQGPIFNLIHRLP